MSDARHGWIGSLESHLGICGLRIGVLNAPPLAALRIGVLNAPLLAAEQRVDLSPILQRRGATYSLKEGWLTPGGLPTVARLRSRPPSHLL